MSSTASTPEDHHHGGVRGVRRRKFGIAHLLRRDGRHPERIFCGVDGGGSAETRARSTDLRTPRELGPADAVRWRRARRRSTRLSY